MVSLARADQNGIPQARIVRYTVESENPGFLLTRTGSLVSPQFWAMFNDAFTEEINPPNGHPRPDPDPAERTKYQSLPGSLQGAAPWVLGSMFSGQMRKVVQCEFSRGAETRFSYSWARTHGLLEWPYPHVTGSDAAAERLLRTQRQYFIIEVSASGVYAAPVAFGMTCSDCALVNDYLLDGAYSLDLAAYYAANPTGQVQRVMTAAQIAPAYAAGSPWYAACGWAFSYSGLKAANVVAKVDNAAGFTAYLTTLLRLSFGVTLPDERTATIVRFGSFARVYLTAHGFEDDDVVSVSGADQDEYNGAHVVVNATADTFDFAVNGAPASPATGDIVIADLLNAGTVTASLSEVSQGRVIFKRTGGSTIWVPSGTVGVWAGVAPIAGNNSCNGPVHVYYDGESEEVTRWQYTVESVPRVEIAEPPSGPAGTNGWAGNVTGTHALGNPRVTISIVQNPSCETSYEVFIGSGFGDLIEGYWREVFGFTGAGGDLVQSFVNRAHYSAQSIMGGSTVNTSQVSNRYGLCGGGPADTGEALVEIEQTITDVTCFITSASETSTGSSSLILFAEEREAVGHLHATQLRSTGSTESRTSDYQSHRRETQIGGPGPWTDIDVPAHGVNNIIKASTPPEPFETVSGSGTITVKASGGFLMAKSLPVDEDGVIVTDHIGSFTSYIPGSKETAESDIYIIRGGLYYDEPQLVPKNQKGNRVFNIDGDIQTQGGFEQLEGRAPIGFVGQV